MKKEKRKHKKEEGKEEKAKAKEKEKEKEKEERKKEKAKAKERDGKANKKEKDQVAEDEQEEENTKHKTKRRKEDEKEPEQQNEENEEVKNLGARPRYCHVCKCIKGDGPGHRSRTGHKVSIPTKEQIDEAIGVKKQMRAKASSQDWCFNFGKHKGRTLEHVWENDRKYSILQNQVPAFGNSLVCSGADGVTGKAWRRAL